MAWSMLDLTWGSCALIATTVLLLSISWRLALVVITIAPVLIFISRFYQVRLLKTSRALRKANSQTTAAFNEHIVGVKTSKSMVREERNAEEFAHLTQAMYAHAVKNALYASMFWPMMLSICGVGTGLALRFGGIGVLHGQMSLGTLATFLQIVFFIQFPVQELTNAITQIQGAQASAERVQSLLDADVEIEDSAAVVERVRDQSSKARGKNIAIDGMDSQVHSIEFRNVGFAYKSGEPVLSNFNLSVRAGEVDRNRRSHRRRQDDDRRFGLPVFTSQPPGRF